MTAEAVTGGAGRLASMEKTATGVSSMVSRVSLVDTLLQPLLAAKYGYWDFGAVAFENPFREGPVAVPDGTGL